MDCPIALKVVGYLFCGYTDVSKSRVQLDKARILEFLVLKQVTLGAIELTNLISGFFLPPSRTLYSCLCNKTVFIP